MMRSSVLGFLLAGFLVSGCGGSGSDDPDPVTKVHPHPVMVGKPLADASDPIVANFAFISCNRISVNDAAKDPLANGSTANIPQLTQTFLDLSNQSLVNPTPSYLFNAGDIVDNEATDQGHILRAQLTSWATAFKNKISVPMIAIPGNHEMLQQTGSGENDEFPNRLTQAIWLDWVVGNNWNLNSGNGPTPTSSPQDNLRFDDSKMSYSFDVATGGTKIHFVVINTDTQNTVPSTLNSSYDTAAWIPLHWLMADIQQAASRADIGAIIMLGHRPIVVPTIASENPINPALGAQLQAFLATQPKFAFYLCGHSHLWSPQVAGSVQQFVVGNGGSELESNWFNGNPPPPEWQVMGGPYFGFSIVSVHASGAIGLSHVWRPANSDRKKYYLPGSTMTSQVTKEVVVFQAAN